MLTRDQWTKYKKDHKIPDGIGGKVQLGPVLDKYAKSKKTNADFQALEKQVKEWIKVAEKTKYKKDILQVEVHLNSERKEIAEAHKEENAENERQKMRDWLSKLVIVHARVDGYYKDLKGHPDLYDAKNSKHKQFFVNVGKDLEVVKEKCHFHEDFHDSGKIAAEMVGAEHGRDYKEYLARMKSLVETMSGDMHTFSKDNQLT